MMSDHAPVTGGGAAMHRMDEPKIPVSGTVVIHPSQLRGTIPAISSKSDAHRKLICAALGDRGTSLVLTHISEDIMATIRCLNALGASVVPHAGVLHVDPVREAPHEAVLDCGESASTLRFLLPVACALGVDVRVTGGGRLPDRPIRALTDALRDHGVEVDSDRLPLRTRGRLAPGDYVMPGDVTSQYISGLLLALPLLEGPSRITLDSPLQSSPYVDMTLGTLELCGALIVRERDCFRVLPKRRFAIPATGMSVEGDWSNAAFFLAAGALGGGVTVKGLPGRTAQGDSRILDILSRMGAHVRTCDDDTVVHVTVRHGGLSGIDLDVSDVPDLLPILSIVSCAAEGATHLLNAGRLRMKESDRLSAMAEAITSLGGVVDERRDSLTVTGHILQGATVFSGGDHRVAMAVAIASTLCNGDVVLTGAESVNKSYPMFFDHFRRLGGRADVI